MPSRIYINSIYYINSIFAQLVYQIGHQLFHLQLLVGRRNVDRTLDTGKTLCDNKGPKRLIFFLRNFDPFTTFSFEPFKKRPSDDIRKMRTLRHI